jgi:hypothetical protein
MATVGMLALMFLGMTLINRILEGAFTSGVDTAIINNILVFREMSVFGWFSIPIPNFSFITSGLPQLLTWDYSFFGGNAALIEYLLYSITAFIAFVLLMAIIGVVAGRIGRT